MAMERVLMTQVKRMTGMNDIFHALTTCSTVEAPLMTAIAATGTRRVSDGYRRSSRLQSGHGIGLL